MDEEPRIPHFREDKLSRDQLAMLELLGNPEIIGSAGTAAHLVDDEEREGVRSIAPRHAISYTCPVVIVLDRTRRIMPNGDLHEVDSDRIQPPLPAWSKP